MTRSTLCGALAAGVLLGTALLPAAVAAADTTDYDSSPAVAETADPGNGAPAEQSGDKHWGPNENGWYLVVKNAGKTSVRIGPHWTNTSQDWETIEPRHEWIVRGVPNGYGVPADMTVPMSGGGEMKVKLAYDNVGFAHAKIECPASALCNPIQTKANQQIVVSISAK